MYSDYVEYIYGRMVILFLEMKMPVTGHIMEAIRDGGTIIPFPN